MRSVFILVVLLASLTGYSQEKIQPTKSFTISGEVKSPLTVSISNFSKFKEALIGDIIITNHLGEKKSERKGVKGILLKDILAGVEFNSSPKELSTFYFVCKASDGYIVVYSWNELFNTNTGNAVYIVTALDGKSASAMDESVLMVSPTDFKTGRRLIKSLASIEVKRAK